DGIDDFLVAALETDLDAEAAALLHLAPQLHARGVGPAHRRPGHADLAHDSAHPLDVLVAEIEGIVVEIDGAIAVARDQLAQELLHVVGRVVSYGALASAVRIVAGHGRRPDAKDA